MLTCVLLLIAAVVIDAFLGDPAYSLHPVRLIGRSIERLEATIREIDPPLFLGGILLTLIILSLWEALLLIFLKYLPGLPLKLLLSLYVIYSSFALRDLTRHIRPVLNALDGEDIIGARRRLQMIVGRDTNVLDRQGILRAAVETAAEGFVDGFLAPIFWYALSALIGGMFFQAPCIFGVSGIWGYRIINTLDSMIGYRNKRYLYFGRFAARLDDIVNFIPARLEDNEKALYAAYEKAGI
jgi:adenosylcobinamide-phosphate synthase